ncbi:Thioesterase/thiol ester dehydrase-isomerase [Pseudovirgaria hyperparasitica]|uniref:Thioesterase/thiol ester dehydrase-isomerase n=1 Tax=Pseudovirgaria hyperparasitica TaxID=470096 RepID=A0A6A6W9Z1_9PEZI|nr:Thioesterase/thiol ester dehydrase-isomerase [Pseudovirgaria hyperparasitica]KAF2757921.1 Thioesterase/thiol ester dehydrase-isomerase [Pseudovirgaria hyperparasitica]
MATTIAQQLAITPLSTPDTFQSTHLPQTMGNTAPIAYGGCALGLAVNAATHTVPNSHSLYSLTGHYLGPTLPDRPLTITITRPRSTRSFSTRSVTLSQLQPNGTNRTCLVLLADFHAPEQHSRVMFEYSEGPSMRWPAVEACVGSRMAFEQCGFAEGVYARYGVLFALGERFFDTRHPVGSALVRNGYGVAGRTGGGLVSLGTATASASATATASATETTETETERKQTTDSTELITTQRSAQWARVRPAHAGELTDAGTQMGALAFYMDGCLSFLPLSHAGLGLEAAAACSSLDFAMRVFVREFDFGRWYLKEMGTVRGGGGRTFSEGRLFDGEGVLVAHMSQQCIMRGWGEGEMERL